MQNNGIETASSDLPQKLHRHLNLTRGSGALDGHECRISDGRAPTGAGREEAGGNAPTFKRQSKILALD